MPGGDDFGARPIDYHLNSFRKMGAEFTTSHGYVVGKVPARTVGGRRDRPRVPEPHRDATMC